MAQITNADTVTKEVFGSMFSKQEADAVKQAIIADAGRTMGELLAKKAEERPTIKLVGGKLQPDDFDSVFRVARLIASLQLYGVKEKGGSFRPYTVEECAVIIIAGARVGMDPIQSMETIALINGKTQIYGRGIRGVVMASGQVEDWQEDKSNLDADGLPTDKTVVTITIKRKGYPTPFVGRFSVALAKQAGLWGGSDYSPWKKYPLDMLTWKAVARATLAFSDVLGGLKIVEDMDGSEDDGPESTPRRPAITKRLDELSDEATGAAGAGREVTLPPSPQTPSTPAAEKPAPEPAKTEEPAAKAKEPKKPQTPEPQPNQSNVGTVNRTTRRRAAVSPDDLDFNGGAQ